MRNEKPATPMTFTLLNINNAEDADFFVIYSSGASGFLHHTQAQRYSVISFSLKDCQKDSIAQYYNLFPQVTTNSPHTNGLISQCSPDIES